MPVLIKANQVKEAGTNDAVIYAWINTSMSITCILEDRSKVGTHVVLFGSPGDELIKNVKKLIRGRSIIKVIAVGNGRLWGPELQDQIALTEKAKENWNHFTSQYEKLDLSYEKLMEQIQPLFINNNIKKFKSWLEAHFKTTNIEFKNLERETFISIDKFGNVMKSHIRTEKL